jgi:hypothetical protein
MGNFIYCVPEYKASKGPTWATIFAHSQPVGKSSWLEYALLGGEDAGYTPIPGIINVLHKEPGYPPNSVLPLNLQLEPEYGPKPYRVIWCAERDYTKVLKSLNTALDCLVRYAHSLYSLQHTELRFTFGVFK